MLIKDIMSKKIITNSYKDDIYEIAGKMKKYDIGFIPITKDNKIIGIITDRDIVINTLANKNNEPIIYTKTVLSIDMDKSIEEALTFMKEKKVKRLIVTNKNLVVGIISLSDLIMHSDEKVLIEALKVIYEIDRNEHDYKTEIDEFYL